jgi:hypothetical protein
MSAISTTFLDVDVFKTSSLGVQSKAQDGSLGTRQLGLRNLWATLGTGCFPLSPRRTKTSTKLGCCEAHRTPPGQVQLSRLAGHATPRQLFVEEAHLIVHGYCTSLLFHSPFSLHLHLVGTGYTVPVIRLRLLCSLPNCSGSETFRG